MRNADAIHALLATAAGSRDRLLEHEVYRLLGLASHIQAPRHIFLPADTQPPAGTLDAFPAQLVLKVVSPGVVHKSDAGGLRFCTNDPGTVRREIAELTAHHRARGAEVLGALLVERVSYDPRFGAELFVGIRRTREFGPVIAAGLGGTDMEYLADAMRPGRAIARAVVLDTTTDEFLSNFRATAAYDTLTGRARGHQRRIGDDQLAACFDAFLAIARACCTDDARVPIEELEVNPFVVADGRLIPLDARARLTTAQAEAPRPPRPTARIRRLLEPRTIAIVGVSAKSQNFGRIILRNILAAGFDPDRARVIRPDADTIDGARCVPSIADLDTPADLLIVAAGAEQLPGLVAQAADSGKVGALIVIPGGVGETEDSAGLLHAIQTTLARSRTRPDAGPVLLGPNCLGVQSRPGRFDTFFIPESKLEKRLDKPPSPVAIVSQSGAFIVSRLSSIASLRPGITVSIGNQADLTVGDMLAAVVARDDTHTIGVYVEGFADTDGLATLRVIRRAADAGKTVVLYKAGRTTHGRSAAAGHTASVAGDYDICHAGALAAGALVASTFGEFEDLLQLSAALHTIPFPGLRAALISNAGFETVGMADHLGDGSDDLRLAVWTAQTRAALARALDSNGLATLVNIRNPLDLTPMAGERAYEACARALLADPGVDLLLLSAVPLTPALATTPDEIAAGRCLAESLGGLAEETGKPIVAVLDAGARYDPLAERIRGAGIAVFRNADRAVAAVGRYAAHRARSRSPASSAEPAGREVSRGQEAPVPPTAHARRAD